MIPLPKLIPPDELRKWHDWLGAHEEEFERLYPGKYVAIYRERLVAVGDDSSDAQRRAREIVPDCVPLVAYIPKEGDENLLL